MAKVSLLATAVTMDVWSTNARSGTSEHSENPENSAGDLTLRSTKRLSPFSLS